MSSYLILAAVLPAFASILIISLIPPTILSKMGKALSLIATGLLLTMAITHLIPEAIEHGEDAHNIGLCIWATILVLIAIEMFFNSKHNESDCHTEINSSIAQNVTQEQSSKQPPLSDTQHHHHTHSFNLHSKDIEQATIQADENARLGRNSFAKALSSGGAAILSGTFLHAICDGVIIASSFMIDTNVGIAITTAIIAHEAPQQLSNYVLMLTLGMSRLQAYVVNAIAMIGALCGALVFSNFSDEGTILSYALAMAGGSFIYVALSDILPRLNKTPNRKMMIIRFSYLLLGAVLAVILSHHG